MSSAIIFIYSSNVGPYINSLSYLKDKREVSDFRFVFLSGGGFEGPRTDFVKSIIDSVSELANGKYEGRSIRPQPGSVNSYKRLALYFEESPVRPRTVAMSELFHYLHREAKSVKNKSLIVDVTGLTKIPTARVLLICLARGYDVHTFELRRKPDPLHPENSLYHSLAEGDFSYSSLVRDPDVLKSIRALIPARRVAWAMSALMLVGVVCFSVLLFFGAGGMWLAAVGLVANVIGILGGLIQLAESRKIN